MIKVGQVYIFTKSGNEVRVQERAVITLNGKQVDGFTVARVDSGKTMFVPKGSLKTRQELGLDDE